jgi:hypothetical protein
VAVLEEKLLKSKTKEGDMQKRLKDAQIQRESNEKEIKILRDKAREQSNEAQRLHTQLQTKLKLNEEELAQTKRKVEEEKGH